MKGYNNQNKTFPPSQYPDLARVKQRPNRWEATDQKISFPTAPTAGHVTCNVTIGWITIGSLIAEPTIPGKTGLSLENLLIRS